LAEHIISAFVQVRWHLSKIKLLGFDQGERSSTTSKGLEIDLGFEHISAWRPI